MEHFDRVLVIANPTSGGGIAARRVDDVTAALRAEGLSVDAFLTRGPGDAKDAAADASGEGTLLVAFGGDGTVNEVLNGADLARCVLAVIPAGTGNVLAKELGVSGRPLEAVWQLARGRCVDLDVGLCNGRRFICMFGAGVDAWVVRVVHERRGRGLSQWHYVPHVAWGLLQPSPWRIRAEVDGRPFARGLDQLTVGNTHSYGGPLELTPAADPADGLLDVMGARKSTAPDIVALTLCGLLRTLHRSRRATYGRGRRVAVTASGRDVPYQLDGEAAGCLPAELSIEPRAARLLAPAGF
ncbi:MAG: diacylglycerol/lipid kinase family protein, partial [Planctomycetota bacterium]